MTHSMVMVIFLTITIAERKRDLTLKLIKSLINHHENMRKATASCLLAVADWYCSLDLTQMQPPSKLAIV